MHPPPGARRPRESRLAFDIHRQPDDTTCGPACLEGVYRFYGVNASMESLIREVPMLDDGGTLGVLLAQHALNRGFRVTLLTWDLRVLDPTWFSRPGVNLADLLGRRAAVHEKSKARFAARAYARFVASGGRVEFCDLESDLILDHLARGIPIVTGLSSTYLYREPREQRSTCTPDDIGGDPTGHFVVLTGYSEARDEVFVSDPNNRNPLSATHTYAVSIVRLIGSIFLGALTYDANLIIVEPPGAAAS
jgi:hypothetical protein